MRKRLNNQKGFTLVEIIAVLILLGILAAVAVPRYVDLTANAELRAVQAGIAELNGRENMTWANIKLSTTGWQDDSTTLAAVDKNLGDEYTLTVDADELGGTLQFKNASQPLDRAASTDTSPGYWSIP